MVGLPYDCLANPLGAVRFTFEKAVAASPNFDPATLDRKDWGAVDVFRRFLFDNGGLAQVPILERSNRHLIRPNSLVRFRGMVQDMLGNELYIGAFKDESTWRTNKFTDVASAPISPSSQTRLWERRLLYCVPIPGQNTWVSEASTSTSFNSNLFNDFTSHHGEKRRREEENVAKDSDERTETSTTKKKKDDEVVSSSPMGMLDLDAGTSLSCLVKIYDMTEDDIKLNDVIEFVGIYTFDPYLSVHESNDMTEIPYDLMEDISVNLPSSTVPRLHCITCQKMSIQDVVSRTCAIESLTFPVGAVRESLLRHLTTLLGNDALAAQFTLLHLLSRVRARVDVAVVGKLSLNLTGFTRESASIFGDNLVRLIKNLLPFSHAIPLSVDYLNTTQLQPRKDNSTGRMVGGVLQLAQGTHLTVDETHLAAGTLNSTGIDNTRLLNELLQWQTVGYDCEFYKLDMPADVQMLVMSEKKSNILPANVVLPFHPTAVNAATSAPSMEELRAWRWFLASHRFLPHSIGPHMHKILEDDFVSDRQSDRSLKGEDFSRWVTMGQLMSASFGEKELSLEHWQMVRELERLRRERLK